jgi:broad specificity phosphatase PhoE
MSLATNESTARPHLRSMLEGLRIILVRHGEPAVASTTRTSHHGFERYLDLYEDAGLDPRSAPPEELLDLVKGLDSVFTSGAPRAQDSARTLLPEAELIADPLFAEAPLTVPRIPLLKARVPVWMVVARILWHAGFHPESENYRRTKARAATAADILVKRAETNKGTAVLVAHGYFNAIIGRDLKKRGFARMGAHRYRFWNAVVYERA